MENINEFIFNPLLESESDIRAYLNHLPIGTGHPFKSSNGSQFIIFRTSSCFRKIKILDYRSFINFSEINKLENRVAKYIEIYTEYLKQLSNYQILTPNKKFSIKIDPNTSEISLNCFAVSQKKGNLWFDLEAITDSGGIIAYNKNTSKTGLKHSGDINKPEPLLHYISGFDKLPINVNIIISVVGYAKNYLYKYINQVPGVFLVDHVNRIVYIIPCPLEQAIIGNATLLGLLVLKKKDDNTIEVNILKKPIAIKNINTGDYNSDIKEQINQCIQTVQSEQSEKLEQKSTKQVPKKKESKDFKESKESKERICTFVSNDLKERELSLIQGNIFYWGQGFRKDPRPEDEKSVLLPHIPCHISGIPAAALGEPILSEDLEDFPNLEEVFIIIHASDKMLSTVTNSIDTTANCIMVITPLNISNKIIDEVLNELCRHNNNENLKKLINSISINAACMAGPNSILLISLKNRLFWYRGRTIPGLIEKQYSFCDEVSDEISNETINLFINSKQGPIVPWPLLDKSFDKLYFWNGSMKCLQTILETFHNFTIFNIGDNELEILNLLTQLSIKLDNKKVFEFRQLIDNILQDLINNHLKELADAAKNAYFDYMEGKIDILSKNKIIEKFKIEKNNILKIINPLNNLLENFVSQKGMSSGNQGIQRRERKAQIKKNVDRVSNSSNEDLQQISDLLYAENPVILGEFISACLGVGRCSR